MPQIDQIMTTFGSQLFWLVLTFGLIYFVIGRSMLPKIQSTVDLRKKRISDDLDAARMAHLRADEIEENYRQRQLADREGAQAITAAAKAQAAQQAEKRLAEATLRIDQDIAAAEADIADQRAKAMAEIEGVAAEAAQDIVQKLTHQKITKAVAAKAVKGAMTNA